MKACASPAASCAAPTATLPPSTTTCPPPACRTASIIVDQIAATQVQALRQNCADFGIEFFDVQDAAQGIVHMIGPELGATKPGMTIVCGDSHTSTHGAFGALAFGIGTCEVEHVMATQTLPQAKPKTFRINVGGDLPFGVTAKDIILDIIGRIGTDGATGYVVEYAGSAIRALSMEGRMTVCNMSIEAGARAGMIAPDDTTFAYLKGRRFSPAGTAWDEAVAHWRTLPTDPGAHFDRELTIDATTLRPAVTWGTSPGMTTFIDSNVPSPDDALSDADRKSFARALEYMDLKPGTPIEQIKIDTVFLGSCTNGRIEDLRAAAAIVGTHRIATGIRAMVVPGSQSRQETGRSRRPRPHLPHRRLRVARTRLQHVPRHEPRHPRPRRTLRLHQQPQLRRPPGPRRPHPPRQPRNGRRRRHHRPLHRHPHLARRRPHALSRPQTDARRRRLALMTPINILTSTAAPLPLPNIDTDQIIPKQFLKRIERTGYGDFLFYDWRRIQERPRHRPSPQPDFVLNKPAYAGAKILIAEKNFGCGSSREHAAWAIDQYGFLAVIAPSFADIFYSNAGKNGIVLVRLDDAAGRTPHRPQHREPRPPDHHQPRTPNRHRRRRLPRPLRHRPLPQALPPQRPRRHRPNPPPRPKPSTPTNPATTPSSGLPRRQVMKHFDDQSTLPCGVRSSQISRMADPTDDVPGL